MTAPILAQKRDAVANRAQRHPGTRKGSEGLTPDGRVPASLQRTKALFRLEICLWVLVVLGCLVRVWAVWAVNPVDHIFSDTQRHWDHAKEPLMTAPMAVFDPIVFQTWMSVVQRLTLGDRLLTGMYAALLSICCPLAWYPFLKELLKHGRWAVFGLAVISWLPSWIGIYGYFMPETLFLPLLGASLWATWRCVRIGGLGLFGATVVLWTVTGLTRGVAIPMGAVAVASIWWRQDRKVAQAFIGILILAFALVPLAIRAHRFIGTWSPYGDGTFNAIYAGSGRRAVMLELERDGSHWSYMFQSPSLDSEPLAPFSKWTSGRAGAAVIQIDHRNASHDWSVAKASYEPTWNERLRLTAENLIFLFFGESWPDSNREHAMEALSSVLRWMWAPLFAAVSIGSLCVGSPSRRTWLLPGLILAWLVFQGLLLLSVNEGRYRKPLEGLLVAQSLVVAEAVTRRKGAGAENSSNPGGVRARVET